MKKLRKTGRRKKAALRRPASGGGGGREIEVKLRVADRRAMLRRLVAAGARPAGERMHEMNTLYDTPDAALLRQGRLVRVRVETPAGGGRRSGRTAKPENGARVTVTYKGPSAESRAGAAARYKIREEREMRVVPHYRDGAAALEQVLGALGLGPSFRYEKYRQGFRLPRVPGLVVDFDETPVGDFLELEGSPKQIDRAAKLLGYEQGDYIARSYGALHLEALGMAARAGDSQIEPLAAAKAPDMLFKPFRLSKRRRK